MKHRLLQLVLLLAVAVQAGVPWAVAASRSSAPKAAVPAVEVPDADPQTTYSLATQREPLTSLEGEWRLHFGDDAHWADPRFDDSDWSLVNSAGDWDDAGYHFRSGTAWYRFHISLPTGSEHFSLYLPVINTSYQVYVNGQLLLTQGKMPPHPGTFRARPIVVDLPFSGPRPNPQTLTVALRVWHSPLWVRYRHGGLQGIAEVGRSDLVHSRYDREEDAHLWQYSDEIDLGVLEMLAAAVAFVLFSTRRSEREFLWFAVLMASEGAGHAVKAWDRLHPNGVFTTDLLTTALGTLFLVAALMFFRILFAGKWTNAFVFALACAGMGALIFPLTWIGALSVSQSNMASLVLDLPVYGWILLFLRAQANKRQTDARILGPPVALLCAALVYASLLWTVQTAGLVWFSNFTIRWRHPFYFTLNDLAEVVFLVAMLTILLRRFALRSREQDRVHSEIEAARSVQQVLVPESLPEIPGLSIETAYHPAQEVGGDFFQILPLPDGGTLIVIGDVAGKGLPAALQVSLVVGTLRALAEHTTSPAKILAGLNRSLQGRGPGFTTCLALCLSSDHGVLTFANAGHIPPYINGFDLRTEPNLPLGIAPDVDFDEVRYTLKPGDHITVLTDGVPEAMHHRELFGFERTGQISRQQAAEIATAARNFGQSDDITVLTVDIIPVPSAHTEEVDPALQPA